jgi:protein-tyrosine phosphatase
MKVLMVCLGNICRSPIAQGVLENKVLQAGLHDWEVDSAGTSGYHDGEGPDYRAIKECKQHGIDISHQISRRLTHADLDHYDLILAMDRHNKRDIIARCTTEEQKAKVKLALDYALPDEDAEVPDPYYDNRFALVYKLLDTSMESLLEDILAVEHRASIVAHKK